MKTHKDMKATQLQHVVDMGTPMLTGRLLSVLPSVCMTSEPAGRLVVDEILFGV